MFNVRIWDLSNTYGFTLSNNSNSDGNSALQFTKINSQEDHQQQQHLISIHCPKMR